MEFAAVVDNDWIVISAILIAWKLLAYTITQWVCGIEALPWLQNVINKINQRPVLSKNICILLIILSSNFELS